MVFIAVVVRVDGQRHSGAACPAMTQKAPTDANPVPTVCTRLCMAHHGRARQIARKPRVARSPKSVRICLGLVRIWLGMRCDGAA
jgi:hypothetical protein